MNTNSLLNKEICIKLNRNWVAISRLTVMDAITFVCQQATKKANGYVMEYETVFDEAGHAMLSFATPVLWDDWIKTAPRDTDLVIGTSRGPIRVPTVVICADYDKVEERRMRWSVGNVWKRDGGKSIITGKTLTKKTGNVGHDKASSGGGRDDWDNTGLIEIELNHLQGTKTFAEMGWKPIKPLRAPSAVPHVIHKEDAPLDIQKPFLI